MIPMMMLLCYVNLSVMSLECIVIVIMNNSLLGGQFCTDSVDIQQNDDDALGHNNLFHMSTSLAMVESLASELNSGSVMNMMNILFSKCGDQHHLVQ